MCSSDLVLSEQRSRNTPEYRSYENLWRASYEGQRLADRMPIGTVETIKAATRDLIASYYEAYYRPERTLLVVAGDFDPGRMEAAIKARFGLPVMKAIKIGAAVRRAQAEHGDPIQAILDCENGKLLYRGKVVDVERRTTEGFLRGRARFDGFDAWRGQSMDIDFQNEWIVARRDGVPIAMSPDLICVLDSVSGEAKIGRAHV